MTTGRLPPGPAFVCDGLLPLVRRHDARCHGAFDAGPAGQTPGTARPFARYLAHTMACYTLHPCTAAGTP